MDVQGSEPSILANGRGKLAGAVAIQCGISFVTLYKNQPAFGEIDLEMRAQEMIPHRFTDVKRWSTKPTVRGTEPRAAFHRLLEADIACVRDLIHPDSMSDADLAKLALIARLPGPGGPVPRGTCRPPLDRGGEPDAPLREDGGRLPAVSWCEEDQFRALFAGSSSSSFSAGTAG